MHPGQAKVNREAKRFNALACGRRWGKSKYLTRRMCLRALKGQMYGYFAASYKILTEVFNEAAKRLSPIAKVNRTERRIELPNGGLIEFWTLDDPDAGRSRKYHEVGIDEAGLVKDLAARWNEAIRPTLTDFRGEAWFAGTPKGRNFFATAYDLGQDPLNDDWASWQMPTCTNTKLVGVEEEVEAARRQMPERSFLQEYEAVFLEDAGGVFRGVRDVVSRLLNGNRETAYLGVDLARVEDFTVISGFNHQGHQTYFERFNQISWERQIERIKSALAANPKAKLLLDSTGVGDPIFERLRKEVPSARIEGYGLTNSSKEALIDNLAMLIEQGRVRLQDIPEQTAELLAYQYELTAARNVRMNAPEGMHDDTVIALALAAWPLKERQTPQILSAVPVPNPSASSWNAYVPR